MTLPARLPRKSDKAEKRCAACDAVLEPKAYEKPSDFNQRETCGASCANKVKNPWQTVQEMLIYNSRVRATTGCWEWQAGRDPKGYGRVGKIDGEVLVHRIAYADAHGAIPAGLSVLHKCDNPRCCNVDHLMLGTHLDNMVDRQIKGRTAVLKGVSNSNYRHGKSVGKSSKPARRGIAAYWAWLRQTYPHCVCGAERECFHHIIHVNGQRITKDDWLVIGLCQKCHQGQGGVHDSGGEEQFLNATGWNLVHLAVLRRHDFEVRT